jgi:hypothetical protein
LGDEIRVGLAYQRLGALVETSPNKRVQRYSIKGVEQGFFDEKAA